MRQYSRWRQVIGIIICMSACGAGFSANSSAETGALQWTREAVQTQLQRQGLPPVQPLSLEVSGKTVSAQLQVQPWVNGHLVEFMLVVPEGDVTSGSLEVTSVTLESARGDAPTEAPGSDDLPTQNISVRSLGNIRGHQVIKVQFGTNASGIAGGRIQSGVMRLQFADEIATSETAGQAPDDAATSGPIAAMLHKFVANPADLDRFAIPLKDAPEPATAGAPPLGDSTAGTFAQFDVRETGFLEFTGNDLAAAGIDIASIPTRQLSVWTDGQQVPVWVRHGDVAAKSTAPTDRFVVYVQDNDSTYTATRRYWIKTDQAAEPMSRHKGMTTPNGINPDQYFMASKTVQQDVPPVLTKNDQFLSILDYRWVWWTWTSAGANADLPTPRSFSEPGIVDFDLPAVSQADAGASLTLSFYIHHWKPDSQTVPFELTLNGQSIGEARITGTSELEQSYPVSASLLKETGNQLEIMPIVTSATAVMPDIAFDRLQIQYPRTYAMTSDTLRFSAPANGDKAVTLDLPAGGFVAELDGAEPTLWATQDTIAAGLAIVPTPSEQRQYMAVAPGGVRRANIEPYQKADDLRSEENSGDVLVISWPDFIEPMQPWIDAKRAAGHDVRVVDVFDIYDQFGYGNSSPHAIRAFIRYAATHWKSSAAGPSATAILLVGDSSSAWRNEFRNDVINYVPVMRLAGNGDSFASDQWYVSIFGEDPYADALIGRFSVNSVEDLQSLVSKQLDYVNKSAPGAWQNTLGFIADHSEFEDAVNRVMQQVVPPRFFFDKVMMSELPWVDNFYFPKNIADAQQAKVSPVATARIRDMFNDGAAVVTYFGHGSPNVWSSERMWFGGDSPNSDNLMLTNRDRLPVVINMTCNSGAIDYPQPRWNVCISEDFMRVKNGGAVACFVPSGPGLTVQHERLMMEIGKTLFVGEGEAIGQSVQLALWRYLAAHNPSELAEMYILLGDPLLVPHIANQAVAPADTEMETSLGAGFVMLPPSLTAASATHHTQFNEYANAAISPGDLQGLEAGARLVRLPDDATTAPAALAISSGAGSATTAHTQSMFTPVNALSGIKLMQWRRTDNPSDDDGRAELIFRLRNDTPLPVRAVQVALTADGCTTCPETGSQAADIAGFGEVELKAEVPIRPGLNSFQAMLTSAGEKHVVKPVPPVAMSGLRPDGQEGKSIPPAAIDPASVSIRYRNHPQGASVNISARVYVLARESLSNLSIGLAGPDGVILPETVVPVAAVGAGVSAPISVSLELPPRTVSEIYTLKFDPPGYFGEFRNFAPLEVPLGSDFYPDLAITKISSPDPEPADGETIFFDVTVENKGETTIDGVTVDGKHLQPSGLEEELKSQVRVDYPPVSLEPGESQTIRLRWDPFQNAGENRVRFETKSVYNVPDKNAADNRVEFAIKVNTKARVRKGKLQVLPLTEEDRQLHQIRIAADIQNVGESDAHGLQVRIYGTPEMNDDDLIGKVDVELLPAGETRQAVITYKLKTEDEDRKFRFAYEVLYQGSRQRVPVEERAE